MPDKMTEDLDKLMINSRNKISETHPQVEAIKVSVINGQMEILDFSNNLDCRTIVLLMGAMGIQPQNINESMCG